MSINDTPEIRETFAQFKIEPMAVHYSISGGTSARPFPELLIAN